MENPPNEWLSSLLIWIGFITLLRIQKVNFHRIFQTSIALTHGVIKQIRISLRNTAPNQPPLVIYRSQSPLGHCGIVRGHFVLLFIIYKLCRSGFATCGINCIGDSVLFGRVPYVPYCRLAIFRRCRLGAPDYSNIWNYMFLRSS